MTLQYLSLFSGIGGMDLGLDRAGMKCVGQVEINPFCRRVLAKHWPNVWRWDDVRTLTPRMVYENCGHVDLIVGGFPCKQTSTAAAIQGRRCGLRGQDSGLWHEFRRLIAFYPAPWVVVENVAGISTWAATIEGGLADLGYRVSRIPVTSSGVGAPHLRRRVLFVAHLDLAGLPIAWPSGPSEAEGVQGGAANGNPWLSSLSRVLRVADGVPGGLDRRERIVALGNAVDPNVAEWIGRRIVAAHQARKVGAA